MSTPYRQRTAWAIGLGLAFVVGCWSGSGELRDLMPVPEDLVAKQVEQIEDGEIDRLVVPAALWRKDLVDRLAPQMNLRELVIRGGPLTADQLNWLGRLPQIELLKFVDSDIGDPAILAATQLPRLRLLKVEGASVTDAGVAALVDAAELRILTLDVTDLTDEGVERLADLVWLEQLRFGSPAVTDRGIEALAKLEQLRHLHLMFTPITDAALPTIAELPRLRSFYLDGGAATDEGLSALLKARPNLHFHQDQIHRSNDPNSHDHGPDV